MAEKNSGKVHLRGFYFICSVETYLTVDGKLPLADC